MLFPTAAAALFFSTALTVRCAMPSASWPDSSVKAPKDFVANALGQGCQLQVVFKRSRADQSWSYGVVGNFGEKQSELRGFESTLSLPISAVNRSAGQQQHGAYQVPNDPEYTLLPLQVYGCVDAKLATTYQVYAKKTSSASTSAWYSTPFRIKSYTLPDQVKNLVAKRDEKDATKVQVSWTTSENQYSKTRGAFVLAGRNSTTSQHIYSSFVEASQTSATLVVGLGPVNISVVRYDNGNNGGLSDVNHSPQVTA